MKKIILIVIILLSSCKSAKVDLQHVQKENITKIDTLLIVKNLSVVDTVFVAIPEVTTSQKNCDSICNKTFQNWLKNINTQKKSGRNSYGFYYDEYKKQLVAYAHLDSTFSAYKSQQKTQVQEIYKEKTVVEPQKYVPFWVQVFAYIGSLSSVYFVAKSYRFVSSFLGKNKA